jgi:hypothetical protein
MIAALATSCAFQRKSDAPLISLRVGIDAFMASWYGVMAKRLTAGINPRPAIFHD